MFCPLHAKTSDEMIRGLPKSTTKQTMEMKFGKTGLASRLREQNAGLVFVGQEITSAAESTESVVM